MENISQMHNTHPNNIEIGGLGGPRGGAANSWRSRRNKLPQARLFSFAKYFPSTVWMMMQSQNNMFFLSRLCFN